MTAEATSLYDPTIGEHLLTTEQVAEFLSYNYSYVRQLISKEKLKPYRSAGKTWLFLKSDIDRFKQEKESGKKETSILPEKLEASINADFLFGTLLSSKLMSVANFDWAQLPLIRAKIREKYGDKAFTVAVMSPDGGQWDIEYNPPTWIDKVVDKIKRRKK